MAANLKVCSIILFILGTIFNSIAIVVYCREKLRKTSMSTYLITYCTTNIILLFINFMNQQSNNAPHRIVSYLIFLISDFSNWILSLVSIDRLVMIYKPHIKLTRRKLFQFLSIFSIFVCLSIANIPYLLKSKNDCNSKNNCSMDEHERFLTSFFNIFDSIIFLIIPFLLMITCSILITIRLNKSGSIKILNTNNNKKHSKEFHCAFMVISMDLIFLLFNLPYLFIL